MKKAYMGPLLLTIIMLLLPPSTTKANAIEQPLAGISPYLEIDSIELSICYNSAVYGVDVNLVRAIINQESSGNVNAVNKNKNGTTDHGLMQINSCNHTWLSQELGITDFMDPVQNIQAGCYILGLLSHKYSDKHQILMAYNMGETQMRRLWRQGIRSSRYSREVMDRYLELKKSQ